MNPKETELRQAIEQMIETLKDQSLTKLSKAMQSGEIPEEWLEAEDLTLARVVIDSVCQDRPYRPLSNQAKSVAKNLRNLSII